MSGGVEERKVESYREHPEYIELKAVFSAIEEFLRAVLPLVKQLIDAMLAPLDGSKLGKDIAEMYRQLKESGMSDEMIEKIVDKYLQKRLEEVPTVTSLLKMLGEAMSRGHRSVMDLTKAFEKSAEASEEVSRADKEDVKRAEERGKRGEQS